MVTPLAICKQAKTASKADNHHLKLDILGLGLGLGLPSRSNTTADWGISCERTLNGHFYNKSEFVRHLYRRTDRYHWFCRPTLWGSAGFGSLLDDKKQFTFKKGTVGPTFSPRTAGKPHVHENLDRARKQIEYRRAIKTRDT